MKIAHVQKKQKQHPWLDKEVLYFILLTIKIFFDIYLFLRERERQREGDRESEAGSKLWVQLTNSKLPNSQTMRSWPELKSESAT